MIRREGMVRRCMNCWRSEEHTSELQSRFDLVDLYSFPTRRSSDLEELALSLIRKKAVPRAPWGFTDDTMMAISVVSTLEEHAEIDQDHLAKSFARNYDPSRGYGPAMHELLEIGRAHV